MKRIFHKLNSRSTIRSTQEKLLSASIRVLVDEKDNYIIELLHLIAPLFGESVLSIINEERKIIASTGEDISSLEHLMKGIRDITKREYYLRAEKNGIPFRREYDCIQVIPITYHDEMICSLIVEQSENINYLTDRLVDVLAMAVHNYLLEQSIENSYYVDSTTRLPNRDALLRQLEGNTEHCYLGMFFLMNERDFKEFSMLDDMMKQMAQLIERRFPKCSYRVGDTKVAVIVGKDLFQTVSALQDCLEEMKRQCENGDFSAAVISSDNELYQMLYLCEKACKDIKSDAVRVIRTKDMKFEEEDKIEWMYGVEKGEEKDDEVDIVIGSVEIDSDN